ncbi:RNA polymerase sigma factor [Sphingobium sp. CCH11-B1]|uniref:RNA polymerase sigma factor n=1 Tax=Sphingobium sp. CCH11-B1 TaxID=1768781 RepID=UPI00082B5F22|nr:sigma-70 family RNA polymerase sigma factor [Sphingobium sp. CCH11-B1]
MAEGGGDPDWTTASEFTRRGRDAVEWLVSTLITDYDLLHARLSRRFGSDELATETLHDIYLKLRSDPQIDYVRHPRSYLYRMSINQTLNRYRKEARSVTVDPAVTVTIPDDAPDPERMALASDEMRRAIEHLHRLPRRQRDIFLARWRDAKTQIEIAAEFGLHKRTVQKELDRAERYLRKKLGLS